MSTYGNSIMIIIIIALVVIVMSIFSIDFDVLDVYMLCGFCIFMFAILYYNNYIFFRRKLNN